MLFTGERYFASEIANDNVVLDIACGTGYGSNLLSNVAKEVISIDISSAAIDYAKEHLKKENINFIVGSAASIPLPNNSVDLITSFETIEHVDENTQKNILNEFKRVLKEDGILLISTPNVDSEEHFIGNDFHIKEFHLDEFIYFLSNYFNYVSYAGQDIRFASSLYFNGESPSKIHNIINESINTPLQPNKKQAKYIVAVCSNQRDINVFNSIMIDNTPNMIESFAKNRYIGDTKKLFKLLLKSIEKDFKRIFLKR